ncbi:MAG: xanthine dehydrogenase FAD-binding subunit XdhB [Lachnospiraceae bacterium]|nr:xanthine dehydrogenase FAD-binding subunit XdhB [Lachnospiraceae bacterium]
MYDMGTLYEAGSVQEAVDLRLEHPQADIIAGGTDVLVQMREGRRAGHDLISIYGIDSLRGISLAEDQTIRIGSLTSFSHITSDPLIQKHLLCLGEAVDQVGGPQIRNAGTIGGNTCNGVTSADSASTLFAYDAVIELTGKNGVRLVPIQEFYIKAGTVDIRVEEGEIQTGILIREDSYLETHGYYIKYAMRNAMDIATLGTSVNARLSPDKTRFDRVRVAFGVAGPIPLRAVTAESFINGRDVTYENIEAFSHEVLNDVHARDSWRAAKDFREHIAVESAKRALLEAVKRCGGIIDTRL